MWAEVLWLILTWMISLQLLLMLFSWMVGLACLILEAAREESHCDSLSLGTGLWMLSNIHSFILLEGRFPEILSSVHSCHSPWSIRAKMECPSQRQSPRKEKTTPQWVGNGKRPRFTLFTLWLWRGTLEHLKKYLGFWLQYCWSVPSYNLYASFFQTSECSMHWPSQRQTFHCSLSKTKLIDSEKEQQSRFARF